MSGVFGKNKKQMLKDLIKQLHAGANPDEVKEKFRRHFEGIGSPEIAQIEEELIKEGMPAEEIHRLCDVHLAVFRESLEKQEIEGNSGLDGIYFITGFVFDTPLLRKKFIFGSGNSIIYRIPTGIGVCEPTKIRELFEKIYEDSVEEIKSRSLEDNLLIAGVSIGNCLAFKLANNFNPKNS